SFVISGVVASIVSNGGNADYALQVFSASLSVGLSTLLMVVTDTEHPPAGGTAIWVAVYGWNNMEVFFIIATAVLLAAIGRLLEGRLMDLV
ncbi:MAG: HPP family protein, partial [Thermoplasmata archaeon]|nr:HPP family protein [Thermoplasmata archaeon]